jgi:hypothetical protein
VRGVITQPEPYYRAKTEIEAEGNYYERNRVVIDVRDGRTEFTMSAAFRVTGVKLDPHFLMLRWTPEYRAEALALVGYTRGRHKIGEGGKPAEFEADLMAALTQVPTPDLYSAEFLPKMP